MCKADLVPFEPAHWPALRDRLHVDHVTRMRAVAEPGEVLARALRLSRLTRTVMLDGQPEAIMGCGMLPGVGYPWLMKTDLAMARFWYVIRAAPQFIAECLQHRPLLRAEVPGDDRLIERWLRWLGFKHAGTIGNGITRWEISHGH